MTEFHKVDEAARRLKVSPAKVRTLIDRGLLKATDVGTGGRPEFRIADDELRDFAERRRFMSYRTLSSGVTHTDA